MDFSLPAERVVRSLNQIIEWRGKPKAIRIDNGPEYISGKLMEWAEKQGVRLEYIQPGKPQQNAYIERYNRTVRGEWLSQYIFETIEEAQDQATDGSGLTTMNDPTWHRRHNTRHETEKQPPEFYGWTPLKMGDYPGFVQTQAGNEIRKHETQERGKRCDVIL